VENNRAAPKGAAPSSTEQIISDLTLREAAIAYAAAGMRVLPLRPNRKEPYGSLVRHGVKDASSDADRVEWWWKLKPDANIGVRTGEGIAVVDVDPRNGGRLDSAWPDTLTARTASGGWHLYYRPEGQVRSSNSGIAPGVDVKAEGGYVVAPPSSRDDSGWTWETVRPMTIVSASILEIQGRRSSGASQPSRNEVERSRFVPLEEIPEGRRHDELTRWAGWLRGQGYSGVEIEEVLTAVNASACASPLPEDELDGIVGWAGRLRHG